MLTLTKDGCKGGEYNPGFMQCYIIRNSRLAAGLTVDTHARYSLATRQTFEICLDVRLIHGILPDSFNVKLRKAFFDQIPNKQIYEQ